MKMMVVGSDMERKVATYTSSSEKERARHPYFSTFSLFETLPTECLEWVGTKQDTKLPAQSH